jgi:hypothetical protein
MNNASQAITFAMIMLGGLFLALIVVVGVVGNVGNTLGNLYGYFPAIAFTVGLLAPKPALYLLVVLGGYIDLLKRLMVFGGRLQYMDLFFLLGAPSIMLLGMSCAIVARAVIGSSPLERKDYGFILASGVGVAMLSLIVVKEFGINAEALKALANNASYAALVFAVPVLLPKHEDLIKFIRFTIIVMIPAGIHALNQYYSGLSLFEQEYVLSGMTMMEKYFGQQEKLIFGTFSSQGMLSVTMGICACLSLLPLFMKKKGDKSLVYMPRWLCILLYAFFVYCAFVSLKRIPFLLWFTPFVGMFMFTSWWRTLSVYIFAVGTISMLGFYGEEITPWLWDTQAELQTTGTTADDMVRLNTFNARLRSFEVITMSKYYTPFGMDKNEIAADPRANSSHTILSEALLKTGYIPCLIGLVIVGGLLFWIHRKMYTQPPSLWRRFTTFNFSLVFSLLGLGVLGSRSFGVFPANFFFWFFIGATVMLIFRDRFHERPIEQEEVKEKSRPLPYSAGGVHRPQALGGKFRPAK